MEGTLDKMLKEMSLYELSLHTEEGLTQLSDLGPLLALVEGQQLMIKQLQSSLFITHYVERAASYHTRLLQVPLPPPLLWPKSWGEAAPSLIAQAAVLLS